jgi:hypothetical protein
VGGTLAKVKKVSIVESAARPPKPPADGSSVEPFPYLKNACFQGFRLVQIRQNAIARIRYILLDELRAKNFALSWEAEFGARQPGVEMPGPGAAVLRQ